MVLISYPRNFSQNKNHGTYIALSKQKWLIYIPKTSKNRFFAIYVNGKEVGQKLFFKYLFPSAKIFKTHGGGSAPGFFGP